MPRKIRKKSRSARWGDFEDTLEQIVPHVFSSLSDDEVFRELLFKARDDGTTLAIYKFYGADGGDLVCFGSGYGVAASLMALDAAMQGGFWRVDKPYRHNGK